MKNKIFTAIFAGLSAFSLLAAGASAEEIAINEGGKVTVQAMEQGVCSIRFSLKVEADEGAKVSFEFDEGLKVRVAEYRCNEDTGIMNVYVADNNPLFDKSESLIIGELKGGKASIIADSFKFTDGAMNILSGQVKTPQETEKPDEPVSSETEAAPPQETEVTTDEPVASESEATTPQEAEAANTTNPEATTESTTNNIEQTSEAANASDDDKDPGTGSFNESAPILITVMFAAVLAVIAAVAAKKIKNK